MLINKTLRLNNLKTRTDINEKISVFVICDEAITYLLLYNLHNCTLNTTQEEEQTWRREVVNDHIRREEFEEQYSPGIVSQGTSGAVSRDTTEVLSQEVPMKNDLNQKRSKKRWKAK